MLNGVIGKMIRRMRRQFGAKSDQESVYMAESSRYSRYKIGVWSYGRPEVVSWDDGTNLVIGKFCSIADNVTILLGGEHRTDWVTTYPFNRLFSGAQGFEGHPASRGDVVIGNDVWIGRDALILSGVSIGTGAVVGAGSIVTKNVDPYAIVAGNPARLIRYRFSTEIRKALLDIAWWDWPLDEICNSWGQLMSDRVEDFVEACRKKTA